MRVTLGLLGIFVADMKQIHNMTVYIICIVDSPRRDI